MVGGGERSRRCTTATVLQSEVGGLKLLLWLQKNAFVMWRTRLRLLAT